MIHARPLAGTARRGSVHPSTLVSGSPLLLRSVPLLSACHHALATFRVLQEMSFLTLSMVIQTNKVSLDRIASFLISYGLTSWRLTLCRGFRVGSSDFAIKVNNGQVFLLLGK